MKEQISIIITILATLLTGGFLMLFIESQKTANNIVKRFHFIMHPFFHSFTNYTKFICFFRSCLIFKDIEKEEYMERLKDNLEQISKLGEKSIVEFYRDYPADYFTSKQLDSVCNTINDIWYCIEKDPHNFRKIIFDTHHAEISSEHIISCLKEISTKYNGMQLTENLLGTVSGDFYVDFYKPIENILPQYEYWQKKEKEFKNLAFLTVILTLVSMLLILLLHLYIPICFFSLLCILCCGLLIFELFKLYKLEELSKKIMR